jgi:hypothetical protein
MERLPFPTVYGGKGPRVRYYGIGKVEKGKKRGYLQIWSNQ